MRHPPHPRPGARDDGFAAGRAFGAGGTPSAVLVDAAGRIASEVGIGAAAVLALAAPVDVERVLVEC